MFNEPSRAYFDPLTGKLFDGYGVEKDLNNLRENGAPITGVDGGVIMSKLGNETAKYVQYVHQ